MSKNTRSPGWIDARSTGDAHADLAVGRARQRRCRPSGTPTRSGRSSPSGRPVAAPLVRLRRSASGPRRCTDAAAGRTAHPRRASRPPAARARRASAARRRRRRAARALLVARTAARVIGPYSPSAATPSMRCSAVVTGLAALHPAGARPSARARDGADHAVDLQPVRPPGTRAPRRPSAARTSPSAGMPSARCAAATAGPRLPRCRSPGRDPGGLLRRGQLGRRDDHDRGEQCGRHRAHRQPGRRSAQRAAPARPLERALPQLEAAQVAAAGRQRADRPAVVVQRRAHRRLSLCPGLGVRGRSQQTAQTDPYCSTA